MDAWAYRHGVKLDFIRPRQAGRERSIVEQNSSYVMSTFWGSGHEKQTRPSGQG